MLNTDFGLINQVFLGGVSIPWLTDGLLAKFSILGVNLWLGFPYTVPRVPGCPAVPAG